MSHSKSLYAVPTEYGGTDEMSEKVRPHLKEPSLGSWWSRGLPALSGPETASFHLRTCGE